jgi:hypothetical protein
MTVENEERAGSSDEAFALTTSRHFPEWMASVNPALPGLQRPSAIGFRTNEVKHVLSIDY